MDCVKELLVCIAKNRLLGQKSIEALANCIGSKTISQMCTKHDVYEILHVFKACAEQDISPEQEMMALKLIKKYCDYEE